MSPASATARPAVHRRPGRARRALRGGTEAGGITLWLLGLCITLLFVGGLSLDLWRAFSERRALAAIADAAAVAGASAVADGEFRSGGGVLLDPARAEQRAAASAALQPRPRSLTAVVPAADPERIVVTVIGEVELTLLRVLAGDLGPLPVQVRAVATPRGAR